MPVHADGDAVNHPKHYNLHPSGVECIDVVRHHNFNVGNAIKYLWRAGLKVPGRGKHLKMSVQIEDLEKAVFYIRDEIARLQSIEGAGNVTSAVVVAATRDSPAQDEPDSPVRAEPSLITDHTYRPQPGFNDAKACGWMLPDMTLCYQKKVQHAS